MSGYKVPKEGVDGFRKLLDGLQRQINELRSAAGLMNAVLRGGDGLTVYDPDTGSRMQFVDGEIRVWDNYDENPDNYGRILVDPGAAINYMRMFPPFSDGDGSENSITVQGRREGLAGNVWVYTDGQYLVDADGLLYMTSDDNATLRAAGVVAIDGDTGVDIFSGGTLHFYELPTTGSAANIRLDPGTAEIQYVTSSRRYKQDIEDLDIDVDAFLRLRPRTWRDKGEMERDPVSARRNVGFIAEEVDDLGLPFVDYDQQSRPDALQYDRFMAGAVKVMQAQQAQIDALTARLDTLESH